MRGHAEFPVRCGTCGGPLRDIALSSVWRGGRGRMWVHARHRDWASRPHSAQAEETVTAATGLPLAIVRRAAPDDPVYADMISDERPRV